MLTKAELEYFIQSIRDDISAFPREKYEQELLAIQSKSADPEFWTLTSSEGDMKRMSIIENTLAEVKELKKNISELEIAHELNDEEGFSHIQQRMIELQRKLQRQVYFTGTFDTKDAIVSIHAGAGGVDAMDFASMLLAMYQSFSRLQGWKSSILELSSGESGGIKSVLVKVTGEYAYGYLKEEAGVHRLIRLSPFNSGNTRETSFASVEVLPVGLEDFFEVHIDEKDLKWDYFLSSGKGGQSVNTTYSAVRVTHVPTHISVACQNERSQLQNKEIALSILRNKLAARKMEEQRELTQSLKGVKRSAEFGSQIRTYTLHPYKLVKDHRSKYETADVEGVFEGKYCIDFIWANKQQELQK